MNPLGTRGRAQELADLLDTALSGGRAPAGLAGASALTSYVGIAARLQAVGTGADQLISPRPEFRDQLRTRLMAVAAVQEHSAPARAAVERRETSRSSAVSWSTSRRAQRGMGVAAGAMASVVAVTGIAVAGGQSLPGDPFYGVKKGVEAFQLRTAGGDVDKGSKHLAFAQERLEEVRALSLGRDAALGPISPEPGAASALGGSAASKVRQALSDMDAQTRAGAGLLNQAYRTSNSDVPLQVLARFAGTQSSQLRALLPDLPSAARTRAEASLAYVSAVAADTSQLLAVGVCTGACAPAAAPPALPPVSGQPQPQPQPAASQAPAPCTCPTPARDPEPSATPSGTASPRPEPTATAAPTASPTASPSASSSAAPLPVPVPVPVPSPPAPLPTLPPLPLPVPTGVPESEAVAAPGTTALDLLAGSMPSMLPSFVSAAPTALSPAVTDARVTRSAARRAADDSTHAGPAAAASPAAVRTAASPR